MSAQLMPIYSSLVESWIAQRLITPATDPGVLTRGPLIKPAPHTRPLSEVLLTMRAGFLSSPKT